MRFRKPEEPRKQYPLPGRADALDGFAALHSTETLASDIIVVTAEHGAGGFPVPAAPATFVDTDSGASLRPHDDANEPAASTSRVLQAARDGDVPAMLTGFALQGLRVAALAGGGDGFADGIAAAAGKRLPFVVHLVCRTRVRQAGSFRGAHDGYHEMADTGAFLMFARNAQEVADFAIVARRIAERALTPGVCAHDLYGTSHSVRNVMVPDAALVETLLGDPADRIPAPGEAQRILFGDTRRRVPVLMDPDRPAGIGGVQDVESHFRALAAQRVFFADPLGGVVDDALHEYGVLTGRAYSRVSAYRMEDAEIVVVAQGAVTEELEAVVDALRRERKIKAGAVNVTVLRPFPGAALSQLLAGKRAVTVLERTDAPLAGDPPLMRDVRAALERAVENGAVRGDDVIHEGYASYRRPQDRPSLISGVYGVGGRLPAPSELVAVYENMTRAPMRRRFYLGAGFDVETRRFPHLQTLRQRLDQEYPSLASLSLDAPAPVAAAPHGVASLHLHSLSMQGALFAGTMFAQSLAHALGWSVRTSPDGGLEHNLQPVRLALAFHRESGAACPIPPTADTALVSGDQIIETLAAADGLADGGILIAASVRDPKDLWSTLSKRAAEWIRTRSVVLHIVDARRIAAETTAHPSFVDQLSVWALLGAYSRVRLGLSADDMERVARSLRRRLVREPGADAATIDEIVRTLKRGADEHAPVAWDAWSDVSHPVGEPDTPWTVRDAAGNDGTVFDPTRFWHSVGYLYDRGQPASTLADPYLATGIIPARSSAFRDMTPYRLQMPAWLPALCTGCAACWAQCPESALPPTVRSLGELIGAGVEACERDGKPLTQIKRVADALVKQATRVVTDKGPHPFETLGPILEDAFARLADKAGLEGERLTAMRSDLELLCAAVGDFPVAATDAFFTGPEAAKAGPGRLLSIVLNPLSCTACGICVAECAEGAIEWVDQTPERVLARRRDREVLLALPALPPDVVASLVTESDADSNLFRLFDSAAYNALVGGDGSFPGNGAKTAVHLTAATIESVMRPRVAAHVERLSQLIAGIEERIHGTIRSGIRVNDFEEFLRRLQRIDRKDVTAATLVGALGDGAGAGTIDAEHLARLTRLLHELETQRDRYRPGTGGDGTSRFVLTIDPATDEFWNGTYPFNPHAQPWAAQLPGDAVALARATAESLVRRVAADMDACRRAELELQGAFDAASYHPAASWESLTPAERALVPRVLVLARPDSLRLDDAWSAMTGDLPVIIAVTDGRGITLDAGGADLTRIEELTRVLVARRRFAAQCSIGEPGHLMRAVAAATAADAPALLRIYAPDPVACGIAPDSVVEIARLAAHSRAVPLFAPGGDGAWISLDGNPDTGDAWPARALTVTDPSLGEATVEGRLTVADWAVRQARFRRHFRVVSRGHRSDRMKPLAAYLDLAPDARDGIQPYIDVRDGTGRHAIALVSAEMAAATARAHDRWLDLRGAAHDAPAPQATAPAAVPPAPAATAPSAADAHRALAENLLRLSGFGSDDAFFRRSLREFVAHEPGNGEDAE